MYLARFAVCIVATMAVIALIAGTAFFIQHHRSERASAQTADAEFQRLRARFADQRPLLDMQERRSVSDVGGPQRMKPAAGSVSGRRRSGRRAGNLMNDRLCYPRLVRGCDTHGRAFRKSAIGIS